ncbi:hypothetical protein [Longispora urticae]
MRSDPTTKPAAARGTSAILLDAIAASQHAPSPHQPAPWRWELHDGTAELWLTTHGNDDRRLAVASCGTALHWARAALAAAGHTSVTIRLPDPRRPELLAELRVTGTRTMKNSDLRRYQSILTWNNEPHTPTDHTVPARDLDRLQWAAERYAAHLTILEPEQVALLDPQRRTPTPEAAEDRTTRYAVLFADADTPLDWLTTGEALGEIVLTAGAADLVVLSINGLMGAPAFHDDLRRALANRGWPMLALRFGTAQRPTRPLPVYLPQRVGAIN